MDQLLHVGYVKTATTFLQTTVFNDSKLGFGLPAGPDNRAFLIQNTVLSPYFDGITNTAAAELETLEAPVRAQGLLPVWSEETLLGDPIRRRYDGPQALEQLKSLFPNAGVLLTIRAQVPMTLSVYGQYLAQSGTCRFDEFLGAGPIPTGFSPFLRPDFLMYDTAIRAYFDAFGRDRVLVLPQEMLRTNPDKFYQKLSAFTGLTVNAPKAKGRSNARRNSAILRVKRLTNHFLPLTPTKPATSLRSRLSGRMMRYGTRLIPSSISKSLDARMQKQVEQAYGDRFDASNRRTMQLTGLPLDELGYRVAAAD